ARDEQEFEDASNQHAPCRCVTGGREEGCPRPREDERQVKENWSSSGGGKGLQRVVGADMERDQQDRQQVGKGNSGEFDGQREAVGVARESWREHSDHGRCEYQGYREQHDLARKQQREDAISKLPSADATALLANSCVRRYKGRV